MRNNLVSIDDKDTKIELLKLQKELESALKIIDSYEDIISEIKAENSERIRAFTHNLANPLQIVSMSLEFLMDQSSQETQPMLLRLLKATEKMTETINQLRIEEQRSRISNSPIKPDM